MRLIDAYALKETMMKYYGCEDATKYGNETAEQQAHSYSTLMLYEVSGMIEDCIDNAPTVTINEWKAEMPIYIKDAMLEALRPQGEWKLVGKNQYRCSECNMWDYYDYQEETCPNFCPNCGADMRGGRE